MKTAFSAILSLREKNLQKCEREILQNENLIANKKSEIEVLNSQFLALETPKSGEFITLMAFEKQKTIFASYIDKIKNELEMLLNRKIALQKQYKELNIEYEKVKFLEQKEQDALIKKINDKEKAELDEVALMLYNNGGNTK